MEFKGEINKFGRDIDTDAIIPARYLNIQDEEELGRYCMEGISPRFSQKISAGDIIVADHNFGCGSSREHAPVAIKGAGISCVIAKSYARIFYRNCINIGLPIFECAEAVDKSEEGDELTVDPDSGVITNVTKNLTFQATPLPDFAQKISQVGGLIEYAKKYL